MLLPPLFRESQEVIFSCKGPLISQPLWSAAFFVFGQLQAHSMWPAEPPGRKVSL